VGVKNGEKPIVPLSWVCAKNHLQKWFPDFKTGNFDTVCKLKRLPVSSENNRSKVSAVLLSFTF